MASRPSSDVLSANQAFYDAFNRRDADAMDRLWARSVEVVCIHPGWRILRGRDPVMESWRAILTSAGAPSIACLGPTAHRVGDSAFVVCEEELPGGRLAATNVFVLEDGVWRMAHHQAGPLARPTEPPSAPRGPGLN